MSDDDAKNSERARSLDAAYEERTKQLHEARGALAEAVAALTVELGQRRAEAAALHEDNEALRNEVEARGERMAALEQVVASFQKMKVVRWSAPVRGIVYRLRARRR